MTYQGVIDSWAKSLYLIYNPSTFTINYQSYEMGKSAYSKKLTSTFYIDFTAKY